MDRSKRGGDEDLKSLKVSANLVMFEYIDELLHAQETDSFSNESIISQNPLSTNKHKFVEVVSKSVIKSSQNNPSPPRLTFKEPVVNPTNLFNIKQDLSLVAEFNNKIIENNIQESVASEDESILINDNEESNANNNMIDESELRQLNNFDCVMIKIDSLLIALPMSVLGTINKIIDPPTQLLGRPKWFLGVQKIDDKRRFNLIDTQDVLFTEQQKLKLKNNKGVRQFSINVFGTNWALACDEIIGSIHVENDDVQWRDDTKSQLISGTIKEKMCMLINVTKLIGKVTRQNVLNGL